MFDFCQDLSFSSDSQSIIDFKFVGYLFAVIFPFQVQKRSKFCMHETKKKKQYTVLATEKNFSFHVANNVFESFFAICLDNKCH